MGDPQPLPLLLPGPSSGASRTVSRSEAQETRDLCTVSCPESQGTRALRPPLPRSLPLGETHAQAAVRAQERVVGED